MKPLFWTLALFIMLAPAMAQDAAPPAMAQRQPYADPDPQPVKLDNGLIVTPVLIPYSELQNMLGVSMWSFLIQPATPDTTLNARVELRMPGKNNQFIGLGTIEPISHDVELTFGMLPIDGLFLFSAAKWRSTIHLREFSGKQTFNDGTSTGELDNPTKNWQDVRASIQGASPYLTPVTVRPNGEVTLITFSSGEPPKVRVVAELVLVLTAKKPEPAKP